MNFKTTLVLLIVVVVGVGGFLIWNPQPTESTVENETPTATRDLFDPKPADTIVNMVYERPDQGRLVFVKPAKDDAPDEYEDWRLEEPVAAKAVNWTVRSLVEKVRDLKYRDSRTDLTDETAGLNPPKATFTITDANGKSFAVEVGTAMGENTFVRKDGGNTVYIVDATFADDLKKKIDEYRDKDLLELTSADATEITIVHEGKRYHAVRNDNQDWVFDAPFTGYGNATKLKSLADDLNWMRADEFVATQSADLKAFGLDAPQLRVEITTVKETTPPADVTDADADESEDDDSEEPEAAPEPQIERNTYSIEFGHFADFDKSKVYARIGDETSVVTISKTNFEKFVPKPNEWREMKVTRAPVRTATQVELRVGGESTSLTKELGQWQLPDGPAETAAVDDLLKAVGDLTATQYQESSAAGSGEFGLDNSRATLTVTMPGQTDPETISVGAESPSGRMAYVRRGSSGSVAVVKSEDVRLLLQPAVAYTERDILSFARARARRIELTRPGEPGGAALALTLERSDAGQWSLTRPIQGPAERQPVVDILADLSSLSARSVVARGDGSDFGLADPPIRVAITVDAPPQPTPQPATEDDAPSDNDASSEADANGDAETEPAEPAPPTVHALHVAQQDDRVFARRPDGDLVYEIDPVIHTHLMAEFLSLYVARAAASQVTTVAIERADQPDRSHRFAKRDDKWIYETDPVLPIDESKVKEIVDKFVELKAERFVDYDATDLSRYELAQPDYTLTLTRDDGEPIVLRIAASGPTEAAEGGSRYALVVGSNRVFLVNQAAIAAFDKTVSDFEKSST